MNKVDRSDPTKDQRQSTMITVSSIVSMVQTELTSVGPSSPFDWSLDACRRAPNNKMISIGPSDGKAVTMNYTKTTADSPL
jgi:hypothetical protein